MLRTPTPHKSPVKGPRRGFTLLEVAVAALVIALVVALAVPSLRGVQDRGKVSAARSALVGAETAVARGALNNGISAGLHNDVNAAGVTFLAGTVTPADATEIGVAPANGSLTHVAMVTIADDGTCLVAVTDFDEAPRWAEAPDPSLGQCVAGNPTFSVLVVTGTFQSPTKLSL